MSRKTINLLIAKEEDAVILKRLRQWLPVGAVVSLGLFILGYIFSVIYLRANLKDFNKLKSEIELLENRIIEEKTTESIYITTIGVLDTIRKILSSDNKIVINTLPVVFKMDNVDTAVSSVSIDNSGKVSFHLTASTIDYLVEFTEMLKNLEKEKSFGDFKASGIVREKDGRYTLSISFQANNRG